MGSLESAIADHRRQEAADQLHNTPSYPLLFSEYFLVPGNFFWNTQSRAVAMILSVYQAQTCTVLNLTTMEKTWFSFRKSENDYYLPEGHTREQKASFLQPIPREQAMELLAKVIATASEEHLAKLKSFGLLRVAI